MTNSPQQGATRSVVNALRVLEAVGMRQPIGVTELSRELGLAKSTVQRYLAALHESHWIQPVDGTRARVWQTTHKALTVGMSRRPESGLHEIALSQMRPIRDALGHSMHLVVREDAELVVVGRLDGYQPLRAVLELGTRAPLHLTASGRAILACLPDEEVARVLDMASTDQVHTDRILSNIEAARDLGYAVNEGEWRSAIAAIGAAIIATGASSPLAAISISIPMDHYAEIDVNSIGEWIVVAAREAAQSFNSAS